MKVIWILKRPFHVDYQEKTYEMTLLSNLAYSKNIRCEPHKIGQSSSQKRFFLEWELPKTCDLHLFEQAKSKLFSWALECVRSGRETH